LLRLIQKEDMMIKHAVMIKLKSEFEGMSKTEIENKIFNLLNSLNKKIDVVKNFEVVKNINNSPASYDFLLKSDFNSLDDLEKYENHMEHLKVVKFLLAASESIASVDYEK
jgi:hypothetical protein